MRSTFFFTIIVSLLFCCTYTPDQEFINPIKPPEPIEVLVEITDPDFQDPFYLDFTTEFSVRFQLPKPVIEWLVIVNGVSIPSTLSPDHVLRFRLNPLSLGSGTHQVQIRLSLKTLSGSLAEQFGAEYYLIERGFEVQVDPQIPDPIIPFTASMISGYMTLNWDLGKNKQYRYQLKTFQFKENYWQIIEEKEFMASSQHVVIDSGYVGGLIRYELTAFNAFTSASIGYAQLQAPLISINGYKDVNNFATLGITATSNSGNLQVVNNTGSRSLPLVSSEVRLDTLVLGENRTYRLILYRNNFQNRSFDTTFSISYSKPNLRPFQNLSVVQSTSQLFLLSQFHLDRYNLTNFQIEEEWNSPYGFEPNLIHTSALGNYLIVGNTLLLPNDFSSRKGVLPYFGVPPSENNFVTVTGSSAPSNSGLQGVSFISNNIPCAAIRNVAKQYNIEMVEWYEPFNTDVPTLSEDSEYMALTEKNKTSCRIFKSQGGSWVLIGRVPAWPRFFRGNGSNELIIIGASIKIYDITGTPDGNGYLPMIREFPLSADQQEATFGYDALSQKIYSEKREGNYSIIQTYNVTDFSPQEKVKAFIQNSTPFIGQHLFIGDYHFLTNGYGEPIKP